MQTKPLILALLAGVAVSGAAQAALYDRGGGLIYDDELKITWLQNANLAATNTFGVSGIAASGVMNWNTAQSWIAAMNTADYLGYDDWRLASNSPVGANWNYSYAANGSTDYGYNITSPHSELSYMYYVNLGLKGYLSPNGAYQADFGIFGNGTTGVQNDVGLIDNLQSHVYWSGTEYAPNTFYAWDFYPKNGFQNYGNPKHNAYHAWAVHPGDIAPIPEPETYALLLAGLGLVGWAARRRRG